MELSYKDLIEPGEVEDYYFDLIDLYRGVSIRRKERNSGLCRGGFNFASTLRTTLERTDDSLLFSRTNLFLKNIVKYPNAATIAWEARRFIRRCDVVDLPRFYDVLENEGKLNSGIDINLDSFWEENKRLGYDDYDSARNWINYREQRNMITSISYSEDFDNGSGI